MSGRHGWTKSACLAVVAPAARWTMAALLFGGGLSACDTAPEETNPIPVEVDIGRPECEFLNPQLCLAPWPSNRYLVPDASTRTGFRVDLPTSVMPVNDEGVVIDPGPWNRWDGFSATSSFMTVLPSPIDASTLVLWTEPEKSLEDSSPTIVINVATGERVAHSAELEINPEADAEHPTLYIRPAARLEERALYAVAIRGLTTKDGTALAPSPVFKALRDATVTTSSELEARRQSFETEVFEPLAKVGVARDTLFEAWSFRTGSGEVVWTDLVDMRDQALGGPEAGDLGCSVTKVVEDPADPQVFRSIEGTFTVPLFLDSTEYGARLVRDGTGKVKRNDVAEAPFLAIIPRSVADKAAAGGGPFRVVLYGHGLFSDRNEISRDFMLDFANKYDTVVIATEWWGLSGSDPAFAAAMLQDLSRFGELMDRVRQSYINQLVLTRAATGSCAALPELAAGGTPVFDAKEIYYAGNSQGGSFGLTLAALSPDIERFALGVGGTSYGVMLPRSVHWSIYGQFLKTGYPSRVERDLLMVMFAHQWDLVEGAAYAPHLLHDPLPGVNEKRILFQVGLDDAQTPNPGSHIGARTVGLPLFSPSVGNLSGLDGVTGKADSAVVLFDEGAPSLPLGTAPPEMDTVTHEAVRRDPRAQAQIDAFLRPDGVIEDFCDGACVAPTPAP